MRGLTYNTAHCTRAGTMFKLALGLMSSRTESRVQKTSINCVIRYKEQGKQEQPVCISYLHIRNKVRVWEEVIHSNGPNCKQAERCKRLLNYVLACFGYQTGENQRVSIQYCLSTTSRELGLDFDRMRSHMKSKTRKSQ